MKKISLKVNGRIHPLEVRDSEPNAVAAAVTKEIHNGLGLRVRVKPVPFGTLPRFDLKARRFTDHRRVNKSVG